MFIEEFPENEKHQIVDGETLVRVLVVEDHNLSAHIAERFLTDLGCQVDCVSDGQTALGLFEKGNTSYDLVLMDVSLPGITGYQLAGDIREALSLQKSSQKKPPHIIALTARGSEENRQQCLSAGMSEVLVKPLLKTRAREILRDYVPKWRAAHSDPQGESPVVVDWDIEGEPVDFNYALTIHDGDIDFIKSALQVVVDSLVVELQQLQAECIAQRWDAGRVIIHKLEGGTRYFGLVRLDQVCEKFSKVLRQSPKDHWREVYNVLVSEVEKVRHVYEQWLKDSPISK